MRGAILVFLLSAAGLSAEPDICVSASVAGVGATESNNQQLGLFLETLAGKNAKQGLSAVLPWYDFTSGTGSHCTKMEIAFTWEENAKFWRMEIFVAGETFASKPLDLPADVAAAKGGALKPEFWGLNAAPQVRDLLQVKLATDENKIKFNRLVELGKEIKLVCQGEPKTVGNCRGILPLAWQAKYRLATSSFYIQAATPQGSQKFIAYGEGRCAPYETSPKQSYPAVQVKLQDLDVPPSRKTLEPTSPLNSPWFQSTFSLYLYDPNRISKCFPTGYEQPAPQK